MQRILLAIVLLAAAGAAAFVVYYNQAKQGAPAATLEAKYANPADQFVDVDGARVRVRIEGPSDAPTLILIHGFSYSLESWDAWAAELKADYRVVRYDLAGHGLTGPDPQKRYAPAERAAFNGAVMDALGIKSASIAGNSLGGLAAWRFAAQAKDRVDALILVSPAAFPYNGLGDDPVAVPAPMKAFLLTAPEAGVRASAQLVFEDDSKITDARIEVLRDMLRREGNGQAMVDSLSEFTLPDPTADLARIAAPTLILSGAEDRLIPVEQADRMAGVIPNAEVIVYDGVGHAAQEEIPAQSLADARAFLTDVYAPDVAIVEPAELETDTAE